MRSLLPGESAVHRQSRRNATQRRIRRGGISVFITTNRFKVFCSKTGAYLDPINLCSIFERLLKKAGLPHMRFHDLRHTAITLMLKMGVLPHVVSEIVGYSEVSITLGVYEHVLRDMHEDAMHKMEGLFRKG